MTERIVELAEHIKRYGCGKVDSYIVNACHDNDYTCINVMTVDAVAFVRLGIYDDDNKHAWLSGLSVAEYARKTNRASAIMAFTEELAKCYGIERISLLVDCLDWRRDWYNRIGYEDNFHDTHLILTKTLDYATESFV